MIKVVILDSDSKYLNRISKAILTNYNDIELYVFTSSEVMLKSIDFNNINVLLVNHDLYDLSKVTSDRIAVAYLEECGELIDDYRVINKYQKISVIYAQIVSLYETTSMASHNVSKFSDSIKLITYTSFCGGTGTSTLAIAEAISKAKMGYKTLYLNLEYFDTTDIYFENKGNTSFSNLVFEIKKKEKNLSQKLEKILIQDNNSGVFYCNPSHILLDKLEINNEEDTTLLFEALKRLNFDYIIIDRNISFTIEERIILKMSDDIRFVVDGRKVTIHKFLKLMNALNLLDEREETNICSKIGVIYNKMSATNNSTIQDKNIKILATINKYKSNNDTVILNEIVSKGMLDNI